LENGILKNPDMPYELFLLYLHHAYSQYLLSPCCDNTAEEFLKQRNFKRTIKLTDKNKPKKLNLTSNYML